jgi:chemotaxis protein CheX
MTNLDINGARVLKEAVSEVFETMFFMDVVPLKETNENLNIAPCIMSSISFTGNYHGSMTIVCSHTCAKSIAMNVLAMEDEDEMEPSDIPDAMGEVANMTMGSTKSRLYEKMGELAVGVPMVISGEKLVNQLRENDYMDEVLVLIDGLYTMKLTLVYFKKED